MRLRGRCGKTADKKLCTGDPLDAEHRLGAQRATRLAACRKLWRWRDGVEECTTSQQGWGPSAVGEEAGVADANQSLRQHVDQEPSQELIGRNGHHLLLAAVVLPNTNKIPRGSSRASSGLDMQKNNSEGTSTIDEIATHRQNT